MPQTSVLMPVYNSSLFLAEAIDSIRNQTATDWELICIDDGSTDNSAEIIARAASTDARIRLEQREHCGIVSSLNHGVMIASGHWIARMDADDIAMPARLATQIEYLQRHPSTGFLGTAYEVIDANNHASKIVQPPQSPDDVARVLHRTNCLAHPSMMMQHEALDQLPGPYREGFPYAEDYDLWLRAIEQFEIANLPNVLLRYRRDLRTSNPERIVWQALSTLGAQTCRDYRRSGQTEPVLSWHEELSTKSDRDARHQRYLTHFSIPHEHLHHMARRVILADAREAKKQSLREISRKLRNASLDFAPASTDIKSVADFYWRLWKLFWTKSGVPRPSSL